MSDDARLVVVAVSTAFAAYCFITAGQVIDRCGFDYAVSHWQPCKVAKR